MSGFFLNSPADVRVMGLKTPLTTKQKRAQNEVDTPRKTKIKNGVLATLKILYFMPWVLWATLVSSS